MSHIFSLMHTVIFCGTILGIVFVVLLSLPQCKLRAIVLPAAGWCVAVFCAIYALSPIDIIPEGLLGPFGLVDDVGAVVGGIMAARAAMKASKEKKAGGA